jgi:hypothetical protein
MLKVLVNIEDGFSSVTVFGHNEPAVLVVTTGIAAAVRAIGRAKLGFGFIIWPHRLLFYIN